MLPDTGFGLDSFIWRMRKAEKKGGLGEIRRPEALSLPWYGTMEFHHVRHPHSYVIRSLQQHCEVRAVFSILLVGKVRLPKLSGGWNSSLALFKTLYLLFICLPTAWFKIQSVLRDMV